MPKKSNYRNEMSMYDVSGEILKYIDSSLKYDDIRLPVLEKISINDMITIKFSYISDRHHRVISTANIDTASNDWQSIKRTLCLYFFDLSCDRNSDDLLYKDEHLTTIYFEVEFDRISFEVNGDDTEACDFQNSIV